MPKFNVTVTRTAHRRMVIPVEAETEEAAEKEALAQAGNCEFPAEHDAEYDVDHVEAEGAVPEASGGGLTRAAEREYVEGKGTKCPFCGSGDISSGDLDRDGCDVNEVLCEVQCCACGKSWNDLYTLAAAFAGEDGDEEDEQDEEDKG